MCSRPARKRLLGTGINSTVRSCIISRRPLHLTHVKDNRHQPPAPVSKALLDLLGMIQNAADPWLLFLYVRDLTLSVNIHLLMNVPRKGLFLSRLSRREE